jgi:hypothetical protein
MAQFLHSNQLYPSGSSVRSVSHPFAYSPEQSQIIGVKRERLSDEFSSLPYSDLSPSSKPTQSSPAVPISEDAFVGFNPEDEGSGSDEDDESGSGSKKKGKHSGRRSIKIEYIKDKSRRHITFSKRKAGILKKV